jgi:hypothetical protein
MQQSQYVMRMHDQENGVMNGGIGKGNDAAAQQQRRYVAGSLLNAGIGRAKVVGRSSLLTCDDSMNLCFFCSI